MAGQPQWRAFVAQLKQIGEAIVLEDICDRIMEGESFRKIAASYGQTKSRAYFYRWLKRDDTRWQKYQEAQRLSSSAYMEQGTEILDNPDLQQPGVSSAQVNLAKHRADWRGKLAELAQPKEQTTVNIGHLHLEALRAGGNPAALPHPKPALEGDVIDAEIIEEE